jgi:hypothetical protein
LKINCYCLDIQFSSYKLPAIMALPLLLVLSLMALVIGSAPAMALTTIRYSILPPNPHRGLADCEKISKGYLGHARQVTSNPGCTYTAFTEPVITEGPTSTSYTLTTYTSQLYDCDGCSNVDVLQLGHVFQVGRLRPFFQ